MIFSEIKIGQFVLTEGEAAVVTAKLRKRIKVVVESGEAYDCYPSRLEGFAPDESLSAKLRLAAERREDFARRYKACITELGEWWDRLQSHPCAYHARPEVLAILARHGLNVQYNYHSVWLEDESEITDPPLPCPLPPRAAEADPGRGHA